jgi:hypothetical protein
VVLKGVLRVEHRDGALDVPAGQAVIAHKGEWARYSTPEPEGAEYTLPSAARHSHSTERTGTTSRKKQATIRSRHPSMCCNNCFAFYADIPSPLQ